MSDDRNPGHGDPAEDLDAVNTRLSEWAACSAAESGALIERFEAMGYEVRGKSADEIAEVLRHPPTRGPSVGAA